MWILLLIIYRKRVTDHPKIISQSNSGQLLNHPKPLIIQGLSRGKISSVGRHHEGVLVHKAPAADDSQVAAGWAAGEVLEGHLVGFVGVPVHAPLTYVAAHVE